MPEWSEDHDNILTDAFGLFTIDVGAGTYVNGTQTNFADIDWGSDTYWLRIEMDDDGGTDNFVLMGVSQMLSVPYSLYAESAGRAATAEVADSVVGDNDLDETNELQTLDTLNGELILYNADGSPNGNGIAYDDSPTNELQTIDVTNGVLQILDANGDPVGQTIPVNQISSVEAVIVSQNPETSRGTETTVQDDDDG